jgi:hypothetical protein
MELWEMVIFGFNTIKWRRHNGRHKNEQPDNMDNKQKEKKKMKKRSKIMGEVWIK